MSFKRHLGLAPSMGLPSLALGNVHKLAVICLFFFISSCGLKPVYAESSQSRAQFQDIYIPEIQSREGQILRSKLQDLLGASNGTRYRLEIVIDKQRREFGIQQDFRISRYDIVLRADYTLIDNETSEILLKDSAKMYSAFNRTSSEFSTFVAEEDSVEQAAKQLAYRINLKLASYFEDDLE